MDVFIYIYIHIYIYALLGKTSTGSRLSKSDPRTCRLTPKSVDLISGGGVARTPQENKMTDLTCIPAVLTWSAQRLHSPMGQNGGTVPWTLDLGPRLQRFSQILCEFYGVQYGLEDYMATSTLYK